MALMAVDHASAEYDARHLQTDGVMMQFGGRPDLDALAPEFLTRWVSHLCAPTFLFLAGTAMALSAAARARRGEGRGRTVAHFALRGALLVILELTYMGWAWGLDATVVQVLYAIGGGMIVLAPLLFLRPWMLFTAGVALVVGCEALLNSTGIGMATFPFPSWPVALTLSGGFFGPRAGGIPEVLVMYPLLPWLGMMLLGCAYGKTLGASGPRVRVLVSGAFLGLLIFALVRVGSGYGDMGLHRQGTGVLEWLYVSKYPPSLAFTALELGLMGLLLALLIGWERRGVAVSRNHPLLVLGQVPLFFYLLHIPLLRLLHVDWLGWGDGVGTAWLAALVCTVLLWPVCWTYRYYKQRWRHGWTRYL